MNINFLKKFKLENLKKSLNAVWYRTPLSVILVTITTFIFLYRVYDTGLSRSVENIFYRS